MDENEPAKGEDEKGDIERVGACPLCGKPRVMAYRPFCSRRCADIDLNRWLGGAYAIPAAPADDEDDDVTPPPLAPQPGEF